MSPIAGEVCYRCGQNLWGKSDNECPTCIRRGLIDNPKVEKSKRVLGLEFVKVPSQLTRSRPKLTRYECRLPSIPSRIIVLCRDENCNLAEKIAKGLPEDTPGWLAFLRRDGASASFPTSEWKDTPEDALRALQQWVRDETWHRRQKVINFEKLAEAMGIT